MEVSIKKESLRQRRVFSESIRRRVTKDIENGKCSVSQASAELNVTPTSIYRWIEKYSRYLKKNRILVVENKSEAYRTKELEKRIKELEAALGRKSLETEYLNSLIEVASNELHLDIKKNFGDKPSGGSKKKDIK